MGLTVFVSMAVKDNITKADYTKAFFVIYLGVTDNKHFQRGCLLGFLLNI